METSGQTPSGPFQNVENHHGSAADNHGQTGVPSLSPPQAMNSAVAGAHDPALVQPMFLSDSEISPISPTGNKGYSTPAHRYKRSLDKPSSDARPTRRAGGKGDGRSRSPKGFDLPPPHRRVEIPLDQTDKEAIKALTEQIRYDEAYMAAMATSMDGMAKTIVDLSNRSQTLEHEWSRWNKWTSDNAVRLMQLEGRINEETNKERAFTIANIQGYRRLPGREEFRGTHQPH